VIVPVDGIDFPGIAAVACIESERVEPEERTTRATQHFVLSRLISATHFMQTIRAHWTIENQLHWVLDVHFGEDASRIRKDNAPQNMAVLRKIALNLLRIHPDKVSIRRKIKKAAWDDQFLTAILGHMR
jgi:predicted transposase YbfD/YdcC